jgi:hypothetical protein
LKKTNPIIRNTDDKKMTSSKRKTAPAFWDELRRPPKWLVRDATKWSEMRWQTPYDLVNYFFCKSSAYKVWYETTGHAAVKARYYRFRGISDTREAAVTRKRTHKD